MCWWIFTGLTHIILEGYFAFTPDFYKVKTPHYLAEVCKSLKTPVGGYPSVLTLLVEHYSPYDYPQGRSTVKATQDM